MEESFLHQFILRKIQAYSTGLKCRGTIHDEALLPGFVDGVRQQKAGALCTP